MVQILDGIFLGDIQVGFNIGAKFLATLSSFFVQASKLPLQDWQISHVVTLDIAKPCLSASIQHLFIPITDEENSNLLGELPKVVSFVQTSLDKGSSTLIHCRHGVSRSAAAVVAVLMSKGWSRKEALARVLQKRGGAAPNTGFLKQLMLWENMGSSLDLGNRNYVHFLLQTGVVKYQAEPDSEKTVASRYKCKKCRRLLASSHNVLQHRAATFPSWFETPPTSDLCPAGFFLTPLVKSLIFSDVNFNLDFRIGWMNSLYYCILHGCFVQAVEQNLEV